MKFYPLLIALFLALTGCQSEPVKHATIQPATLEGIVKTQDGLTLHYTSRGDGDTALVLVHCWSCNSTYWKAQLDKFATQYQVIAIDLAGHGQSDGFRRDYTIDSFANDVSRVIKGLDLKKVILVGHSMGGPISIETALKTPGRVLGVVAVDSFNTSFQWPAQNEIPAMLQPFETNFHDTTYKMVSSKFAPTTDPVLVDRIANDMASAPQEVALSALSNVLTWMQTDYPGKRKQLQVPLININAAQTNKPAEGENIITVEGTGHFIPQEVPEQFNEALEQAINSIKK